MQEVSKLLAEINSPSFSYVTGWPPGTAHVPTTQSESREDVL